MPTPIQSEAVFLSTVAVTQRLSGITNASATWSPGDNSNHSRQRLKFSSASFNLSSNEGYSLRLRLLRKPMLPGLDLLFSYKTPTGISFSPMLTLPAKQAVYFELDVDPRNSNVKFWIDHQGYDMGVLRGFKGGGDEVAWGADAVNHTPLIDGRFANCALATVAGWQHADLPGSTLTSNNLHTSHKVEVFGLGGIAFGDKRYTA